MMMDSSNWVGETARSNFMKQKGNCALSYSGAGCRLRIVILAGGTGPIALGVGCIKLLKVIALE